MVRSVRRGAVYELIVLNRIHKQGVLHQDQITSLTFPIRKECCSALKTYLLFKPITQLEAADGDGSGGGGNVRD